MALKGRVVPFALTAGVSSGTIDITHGDIGDAKVGYLFVVGATAMDTLRNHAAYCLGAVCRGSGDVITQGCMAGFAEHNQSTADTYRIHHDDRAVGMIDAGGSEGELEVTSWISGGFRCTYRSSFTAAYRGFAVIIDQENSLCAHSNALNLNSAPYEVTFPGFKVDGIIAFGTTGGASLGAGGKGFFGVAGRDAGNDLMDDVAMGWELTDGTSAGNFSAGLATDRISLRTSASSNYYATYLALSATANGFTTDRNGAANLSGSRCLTWTMPAGQGLLSGAENGPTSTGSHSIATNYPSGDDDSDVVIFFGNSNNDSDTTAPSDTDGIFFGAADSTGTEACIAALNEAGAGTTVCKSFVSNSSCFVMYRDAVTLIKKASLTNLTGGSVTVNYSTADSSNWRYGWLAFQAPAASGETGSVSDGLSMSETIVPLRRLSASRTDGLIGGEGNAGLASLIAQLSGDLVISDIPSALASYADSLADGMIMGDTHAGKISAMAQLIDGLSLSDDSSASASKLGALADELVFGDTISGSSSGSNVGSLSDGLELGDSLNVLCRYLAAEVDGLLFSDAAIAVAALIASHTDGLDLSDASIGSTDIVGTMLDNLGFSDASSALSSLVGALTDDLQLAETAQAICRYSASVADALVLSDSSDFPDEIVRATARVVMRAGAYARAKVRAGISSESLARGSNSAIVNLRRH